MIVETDDFSSVKRKLILRDTLTLLTLLLVTVVLFLITLFLFRSFSAHRDELAQRWSARGQRAISSGRPEEAIVALRTALSYAPGERSYELLLAQALGDAGHLEESYNYFLNLWETQPGDGMINLDLARLAVKRKDKQAAINSYRAAIYGTWEGDGTVRRREARLELARFLITQHDFDGARAVLLVAGGNAPADVPLDLTIGSLLEQASDTSDALTYYRNVLTKNPDNQVALVAAGRLEYEAGDFEEAHQLFERATHERHGSASGDTALSGETQIMAENSARLLALAPSQKLPSAERVDRILKARDIAKIRFDACNAQLTAAGQSSSLQNLAAAWAGKEATLSRRALLKDSAAQESAIKLIFDTETVTGKVCGTPTGNDALLLLLAQHPTHSTNTLEP